MAKEPPKMIINVMDNKTFSRQTTEMSLYLSSHLYLIGCPFETI